MPLLFTGHPTDYSMTVSGINVINRCPLDIAPIRWTESGPGTTGSCSFLLNGSVGQDGAVVRLRDNVNARTLFGGVLLSRRFRRGPGSVVWTEYECASWDWFLDNRAVPRYESRRDVGNRVRKISSDRGIVKDLIERRGGPIEAFNSDVDETNTDMDVVQLEGEMLRGALELIADEAQTSGNPGARHFYVDGDARLHWFKTAEGLVAPYRIADGSYIRDVKATANLVEYWSMREEGGTTNHGVMGVANLTQDGSFTQGVTDVGVVNEPAYRAVTLGATSDASGAHASLFPGDAGFSLSLWFKRSSTQGTTQVLLTSSGGTDDGPELFFTTANKIRLNLRTGSAQDFITTASFTDTSWHHLFVTHSPGLTTMYVDGASVAGTLTSQTFGTGSTTFTVGHPSAAFVGSIQHVAVYATQVGASTVLAHYRQGRSIAPEDLEYEIDADDTAHFAYVISEVKGGSGWVRPDNAPDWDAGTAHIYVEARKVKTAAQRNRRGKAELNRHKRVRGGRFSVLGYQGWRTGQALPVTDSAIPISETFAVAQVTGELGAGSVPRYEIEFGTARKTLLREVKRRKRRER